MSKEAIDTLKNRLAKGEISLDEYNNLLSFLTSEDNIASINKGTNEAPTLDDSKSKEVTQSAGKELLSTDNKPENVGSISLQESKKRFPFWGNAISGLLFFVVLGLIVDSGYSFWIAIPAGFASVLLSMYLIGKMLGLSFDEVLSSDDIDVHNMAVSSYGMAAQFSLLSDETITSKQQEVIDMILPSNQEIRTAIITGFDKSINVFEYADAYYKAVDGQRDDGTIESCLEMYQVLWVLAAVSVKDNSLNLDHLTVLRKITKNLHISERMFSKYEKEFFEEKEMLMDLEDSVQRFINLVNKEK